MLRQDRHRQLYALLSLAACLLFPASGCLRDERADAWTAMAENTGRSVRHRDGVVVAARGARFRLRVCGGGVQARPRLTAADWASFSVRPPSGIFQSGGANHDDIDGLASSSSSSGEVGSCLNPDPSGFTVEGSLTESPNGASFLITVTSSDRATRPSSPGGARTLWLCLKVTTPRHNNDTNNNDTNNTAAIDQQQLEHWVVTNITLLLIDPPPCSNVANEMDSTEATDSTFASEFASEQLVSTFAARCPVSPLLPLWLQSMLGLVLLLVSGLLSGLTVCLMALDRTELRAVRSFGSPREREYARLMEPLRRRGNVLFCALLLGNVLANAALTLLLHDLLTVHAGAGPPVAFGWALLGATLGVTLCGEVGPQALCSRFGLALGAHAAFAARCLLVVTFPVAWPLGRVLDRVLRQDIGAVFSREKLLEMLRVSLSERQESAWRGALDLRLRTVQDVMTPLPLCFMISIDSTLDFQTMSEVMQSGCACVPVYEEERGNVVDSLCVGDLSIVDPADRTPLRTIARFYSRPLHFVFNDTRLHALLDEFRRGRSQMAIVQRVNCEGEGDPFYEAIGVITLEDVVEDIIRSELLGDTDMLDCRARKRVFQHEWQQQLSSCRSDARGAGRGAEPRVCISPQLLLKAHGFLTNEVPAFRGVSEKLLLRLLRSPGVVRELRHTADTQGAQAGDAGETDPNALYTRGLNASCFTLILQGKVQVVVGRDPVTFESSAFSYYGIRVVTPDPDGLTDAGAVGEGGEVVGSEGEVRGEVGGAYQPDYTVRALTDLTVIQMTRDQFLGAFPSKRKHAHSKLQAPSKPQLPKHSKQQRSAQPQLQPQLQSQLQQSQLQSEQQSQLQSEQQSNSQPQQQQPEQPQQSERQSEDPRPGLQLQPEPEPRLQPPQAQPQKQQSDQPPNRRQQPGQQPPRQQAELLPPEAPSPWQQAEQPSARQQRDGLLRQSERPSPRQQAEEEEEVRARSPWLRRGLSQQEEGLLPVVTVTDESV